jgi:hypothetical protein
MKVRVTRGLKIIHPIFLFSQNCSQIVKAQLESPQHKHPSAFQCQNKHNKPFFGKNVKNAKAIFPKSYNFAQSGHTAQGYHY